MKAKKGYKVCSGCKRELHEETAFNRHRTQAGGRQSYCRECQAIHMAQWKLVPANAARMRASARERYARNKESIRAMQNELNALRRGSAMVN